MTIEILSTHNSRSIFINGHKIIGFKSKTGLTIYANRITTIKFFRTGLASK